MSLWTPAEITTSMWLDASDDTSVAVSGSVVTGWNDKSGNARNFDQTTNVLYRPTYVIGGLNGLNIIRFDGSDDFLEGATATKNLLRNVATASVFVVATNSGGDTTRTIFSRSKSGISLDPLMRFGFTSTQGEVAFQRRSTGDTLNRAFFNQTGTTSLMTFLLSGQADNSYIAGLDGVNSGWTQASASEGLTDDTDAYRVRIGGRSNTTNRLNGDVAEIIFLPTYDKSELTIGPAPDYRFDIGEFYERIEGYLAHKWGIAAQLPNYHRYKLAAPTLGYSVPSVTFNMAAVAPNYETQREPLVESIGKHLLRSGSWTKPNIFYIALYSSIEPLVEVSVSGYSRHSMFVGNTFWTAPSGGNGLFSNSSAIQFNPMGVSVAGWGLLGGVNSENPFIVREFLSPIVCTTDQPGPYFPIGSLQFRVL